MGTIVLIVALFVVAVAVVALVLWATGRTGGRAAVGGERPRRPLTRSPAFWVGVCAVSLVLGIVVAPRLFGTLIVFLPFILAGGLGRRRPRRPE